MVESVVYTCGSSADLEAKPISVYGEDAHGKWSIKTSPVSGVTFGSPDNYKTTVNGLTEKGQYEFIWTVARGAENVCEKSASVLVNVDLLSVKAVSSATVNGKTEGVVNNNNVIGVCGTTVTITPNKPVGAIGKWYNVNGEVYSTDSKITLTGLTDNVTRLIWQVERGTSPNICTASDEIMVYNDNVTPSIDVASATCTGNITMRTTNDLGTNLTGEWSTSATKGSFTNNTNENVQTSAGPVATFYNIAKGATANFKWTLNHTAHNHTCKTEIPFTVTNYEFDFKAGQNAFADCDGTYTLQGSFPDGLPSDNLSGEWSWDQVVTISDKTNKNAVVSNLNKLTPTKFTWTVSYQYGDGIDDKCSDSRDVVITNNQVKEATASFTSGVSDYNGTKIACGSTISLSGTSPDGTGEGRWTIPDGVEFVNSAATDEDITVTNLGKNKEADFTWTISREDGKGGKCSSSKTLTVKNMYYEAKIYTADYQLLCNKNSLQVDANDVAKEYGAKGWWEITNRDRGVDIEGGWDNKSTENSIVVTGLPYGETKFTWYVQAANCAISTASITVKNGMVTANAGTDDITCTTEYESLNAVYYEQSDWTGSWSCEGKDVLFDDSNNYITKVTGMTTSGAYQFKWTVKSPDYHGHKGCETSDIVEISANGFVVDADDKADNTTKKRAICGDEAIINATRLEGTGEWTSKPAGLIVGASTNSSVEVNLGGLKNATFTWTETRNGCPSTDYVTLNNIQPEANGGRKVYYACDDNNITLAAREVTAANTTYGWSKKVDTDPGQFTGATNINNAVYTFNALSEQNKSAVLVWTVTYEENGLKCSKTDEVTAVYNKFVPEITAESAVCAFETEVSGTIPKSGYTGVWTCTSHQMLSLKMLLTRTRRLRIYNLVIIPSFGQFITLTVRNATLHLLRTLLTTSNPALQLLIQKI